MPDLLVPLALGEVARNFGCALWQVRRLFERGLLPPAPRVGRYRVVDAADLPRVEEALRRAGYLPPVNGTAPKTP